MIDICIYAVNFFLIQNLWESLQYICMLGFCLVFWGRDMVIKILATLLVLPSLYQLHLRKFDPSKYKMIRSL